MNGKKIIIEGQMTQVITEKEVLKIARLSNLLVSDKEISQITSQLDSVLSYAARVKIIEGETGGANFVQCINKTRSDVVDQVTIGSLLDLVPEKEGSLIIVPMILETV